MLNCRPSSCDVNCMVTTWLEKNVVLGTCIAIAPTIPFMEK
jgi:hypothetical protein